MSDLLPSFLAACDRLCLMPGGTVVIAVSGGADSMALWDLAARAGRWQLVVWHLDHGLRDDAHADAELIQRVAAAFARQGLPAAGVVCERADIARLAQQWRCSLETAGRRGRYALLAEVARRHGAARVLTAHHRDDQAETVLFNLLRGAGPMGQAGIPVRRALAEGLTLWRPLLAFDRAELRWHLAARGLAWQEDSTNLDLRFTRNWLRQRVLPGLEEGLPGVGAELARLAERQAAAVAADEGQVEEVWRQALGCDELQVGAIALLPARLRLALWRRLLLHLQLPLARRQLQRLEDLVAGPPGRRMSLGLRYLVRRERAIAWEGVGPEPILPAVSIPGPGTYHRGSVQITVWSADAPEDPRVAAHEACLAGGSVGFPLEWRAARTGERWTSLGAPGSQTLARWLANRAVPAGERAVAVVADAQGIVWVPGHTIAERCRVQSGTREVLRLALGGKEGRGEAGG